MKKYYLYYGTEENAYEPEKFGPKTLEEALDTMQEWFEENGDDFNRKLWEENISKNGYDYEETDNSQGYYTVMGIAMQGKCNKVRSILTDYRREMLSMF